MVPFDIGMVSCRLLILFVLCTCISLVYVSVYSICAATIYISVVWAELPEIKI